VSVACVEVFDNKGEASRRLHRQAMRPSAARHWPVWNKLVWRATWVRLSVLTPGFLFLLSRPMRLDSRRGVALHSAWDGAEGGDRDMDGMGHGRLSRTKAGSEAIKVTPTPRHSQLAASLSLQASLNRHADRHWCVECCSVQALDRDLTLSRWQFSRNH
jgi:hypothetical protein